MPDYDGSIRIGTKIDTKGFEEDGKELESKSRKLAESLSGSSEVEVKIDSSGAKKEFEKVFDDIEKEEKRITELAERSIERARSQQEEISAPDIQMEERTFQPGYNQEAIKYIEEHTQKVQQVNEHWNQLKIDVEEYAKSLKELQIQGKFLGDEDYDKVYLAWKNATDAVKAYQAELNKQTESGQAKIAEQEAKAAEKQAATQEKAAQKEADRQAREEARIAAIQAKEEERRAKEIAAIQAQEQEEQRLDQIRVNSTASNQQIIDTLERRRQLASKIADMEKAGVGYGYQEYDSAKTELSQIDAQVKEYKNSLSEVPEKFSKMKSAAQKAFNAIKSGLSTVGKIGKKAFSGLLSVAKKAFSAITSGSKKSNSSMSGGLKSIIKYGLGIVSLTTLFNKMRSAAKEGLSNLVQYSSPVNESLSMLKSSLTQLKNSLATAFAPILTTIAPILTSFINMLSKAATYVGMLIATLTGAKTFTKATEVQEDYAASLNKTAGAAKKAAGALAKFDDLDVLNQNDSSGSGAGSENANINDMFEEVKIPDRFQNIAQWFKDMWEDSDFYELGSLLGDKIKDALDNIPWNEIKEKSVKIAKSVATFLNGAFETENLGYSIGSIFANSMNAGILFLNEFLKKTNWKAIGHTLSGSINGFINEFEWETLGNTIGNGINSAVDMAKAFLEETNFYDLGKGVADSANAAMETTDWKELAETISLGIEGALDSAIGFLEEFDWEEFANSIEEFLVNVDWKGIFGRLAIVILDFIKGAFMTAGNKIGVDLTDWLADFFRSIGWDSVAGFFDGLSDYIEAFGRDARYIFETIVNWIKEELGIHSPSTVFAEIGENVILGLINGVSSMFSEALKPFEDIKDSIIEVWENFKKKTSEIWEDAKDVLKNPINGMIDMINEMIKVIVSGVNFMISSLNQLKIDVPDWIKYIPGLSGIAGKTFGFNISEIKVPQIPRLATGTVIRGGNPFMAVLGDQPAGQTNIEAPLDTIKQAVREELSGMNLGNAGVWQTRVVLNINGIDVGEAMLDDLFSVMSRRGYDVSVLGVT